jgi:hypothetical protein
MEPDEISYALMSVGRLAERFRDSRQIAEVLWAVAQSFGRHANGGTHWQWKSAASVALSRSARSVIAEFR